MARQDHQAQSRFLGGLFLLIASVICGSWSARASSLAGPAFTKGLSWPVFILELLLLMVPGLLLAAAGYCWVKLSTNRTWRYAGTIGLGVLAVLTGSGIYTPSVPLAQGSNARMTASPAPLPKSGEEILINGIKGGFKRIPDPRVPAGDKVLDNWKPALWTSILKAVDAGDEQVVIMFSMKGCPYCDMQVKALQKILLARAATLPPPAEIMFGDKLRVFVLDAQEFLEVIRANGIESFPVMWMFGRPGISARQVAGYQDEEKADRLIRSVARTKAEVARKRRWFR